MTHRATVRASHVHRKGDACCQRRKTTPGDTEQPEKPREVARSTRPAAHRLHGVKQAMCALAHRRTRPDVARRLTTGASAKEVIVDADRAFRSGNCDSLRRAPPSYMPAWRWPLRGLGIDATRHLLRVAAQHLDPCSAPPASRDYSACVASHAFGRHLVHVDPRSRGSTTRGWFASCTRSVRCDDTLDETATLTELCTMCTHAHKSRRIVVLTQHRPRLGPSARPARAAPEGFSHEQRTHRRQQLDNGHGDEARRAPRLPRHAVDS